MSDANPYASTFDATASSVPASAEITGTSTIESQRRRSSSDHQGRVVITDSNLGADDIERTVLCPSYDLVHADAHSAHDVVAAARGAVGILVQWAPITAEVINELTGLRAIVRYGVGLDNIDVNAAKDAGVAVANVPDYCIDEVAMHACALIVAESRRLHDLSAQTRSGCWNSGTLALTPRSVSHDPVGIAGFGRIGRNVAMRLRTLGFPVHVYDPYIDPATSDGLPIAASLRDLAGSVRHLSLHLPSAAETLHICDADVLDALGPDGHLVNTSRGSLVDEAALLRALDNDRLQRASLDVFANEPPSEGTSLALMVHRRVTATPHVAYLSDLSTDKLKIGAARRMRELLEKLAEQ